MKKGASSVALKTSSMAKATGEKAAKAGFTTANLKKRDSSAYTRCRSGKQRRRSERNGGERRRINCSS